MKEKLIKVWEGDFAFVKSKKPYENAFANIKGIEELTVIIEQNKINEQDIIEIEKDLKLITFDMKLDFSLVGFISKISSALADKGISLFIISSYSTDHLMVKKDKLEKTLKILKELEIK